MRNKIVNNILALALFVLVILIIGFAEEAIWMSAILTLPLAGVVWCINQLWVDEEEADEWTELN